MIDFVGEEMNYGKAGDARLCGAGPWWIGFVLFQYMVSVCSYLSQGSCSVQFIRPERRQEI